jgi:glycosyltransferase involved in cell wall biosynthesis
MEENQHRQRGTGLRVAVVHSFYSSRQSSGENRVVEQQVEALRRAGISVQLIDQRTDARERSKLYAVEAAFTVATGHGRSPLAALHEFRPNIVHVHNLFPNFSRSWVTHWDGPIVATMHNYRPMCPAATFYRDGHACTDCLDKRNATSAVRYGCYRGNRAQTVPLALSTRFGADPLLARADRVIVLNDTMKTLYGRAGVAQDRMTLLPNFLPDSGAAGTGGGPWLFVGRLTPEKGILQLVREWPSGYRLLVVGDGPLLADIAACAPAGVEVLGEQPSERVQALMREAVGLVFPSRWFEGAPMVYVEALAAGTPVLAWEPSSLAALVSQEETGVVAHGDLGPVLAAAEAKFPFMRPHCRSVFENEYTEAKWVTAVANLYARALGETG